MKESEIKKIETELELGQLYFEKTDFVHALEHFEVVLKEGVKLEDKTLFLKAMNLALRLYAELENFPQIVRLKDMLQDLIINNEVQPSSRTFYTLALCSSYKDQPKQALEYLEKALALALATDEKEDICYAIHGLAAVYVQLDRPEDALKEIYNLKVFFQVLELQELKLSNLLLNGHIFRRMKDYDRAIEIFWQCYEMLKDNKNYYFFINVLYALGASYADAGNTDMARLYLSLAKRTADPVNMKRGLRHIDERLSALGVPTESKYDLIFNLVNNSVVERRKGSIDFKNQFILLDLLKLFVKTPGEVFTKETIVRTIWKQEYNPEVHDNKIYVTIKRLRQMIEPDYDKPRYIFRAKNGYYLNRNTKIHLENHNQGMKG